MCEEGRAIEIGLSRASICHIILRGRRNIMRLVYIDIKNFRGIKSSSTTFPIDSRIVCLIGSGDSTKTTLLKAIEWVLWPSWNLNVTDMDFYNCDIKQPITITASLTEVPEALLREDKFGLYLRSLDKVLMDNPDDEPDDSGKNVLTIRFTVDSSLEPKWEVITNRTEPKSINQNERRLLTLGYIGLDQDKDFQWGRYSILQKYADSSETLHNAFTQSMRNAINNTGFDKLDEAAPKIYSIGSEYGVYFNGEIHNRILMQNGTYSTTVGIFDDKVPFTQRGSGSKKLLSIGMNVNSYSDGTIVLVDEIETGLEPYRISALINQFRTHFQNSGQIIMTTHSRSVVCECTVDELCVVNSVDGELCVYRLNEMKDISKNVQALIRGEPDAFLCKRIIVCEGKTEIGLMRAYADFLYKKKNIRFAHYGVGIALGGGGKKAFTLATLLNKCGYDCCILMDSDRPEEKDMKDAMMCIGIPVFSWEDGNAIEEQIFKDVTIDCAELLLSLVAELRNAKEIWQTLDNEFHGNELEYTIEEDTITLRSKDGNDVNPLIMKRIGTIAKGKKNKKGEDSGWFKRIDLGQEVGNILFGADNYIRKGSCFGSVMNSIYKWVTANERR